MNRSLHTCLNARFLSAPWLRLAALLGHNCCFLAVADEPDSAPQTAVIERLPDAAGLQNLHRAGPDVLVGSEPHGDEALSELCRLGVTTIVSVDGARPDVEAARRHGLRYIHIPIGYDGVPADAVQKLARVARETSTPVYVHCHHGKHRGPAAAAVICRIKDVLSAEQAMELLTKAGTGLEYAGLWRDVRELQIPEPPESPVVLEEIAKGDSVATAMATLDRAFDHLKLVAAAGWQVPKDHPDLVPLTEAVLVREGFTESVRHVGADHPEQFRLWLAESATQAEDLEAAIRAGDSDKASALMKAMDVACRRCHVEYRNN